MKGIALTQFGILIGMLVGMIIFDIGLKVAFGVYIIVNLGYFLRVYQDNMKRIVIVILLVSFAFGQANIFETEKPDLSISKPQYEYVVFWQKWNDASHYLWVDGSQPTSQWEYYVKGFESLDGMLKWLNSSNYYYPKQKRVRLNDNQIIAIYDLTRAKKVHLKIVKTEMVEPYKVETKERKWTDVQWQLEE